MLRCRNESIGTLIRFANCAWIVALFGFRGASSEREKESTSIFLSATRRSLALRRSGGRAFDQASIAFLALTQAGCSSQSWLAATFRQHFGFGPADVSVRGERRWT